MHYELSGNNQIVNCYHTRHDFSVSHIVKTCAVRSVIHQGELSMSEDFKNLNNIRILRAQARELPAEALEEILEKFTIVVEERREEEASQRKEIEEKQAKLEAFRAKLLEEGIDPSELLSTIKNGQSKAKSKSPSAPRPAKYKYVDVDGSEKTWTGQGRTPKAISKALEEGKKLEDLEINLK